MDLGDFYLLEADGRFRSASPSHRRQSSDLDFVDPSKVLDDGAFVYIENDTTALVFDGMEVRELHYADLSPLNSLHPITNATTDPAASGVEAPAVLITSNTSTIQPPAASAESLNVTSTVSPQEAVRPEVQDFLARIRYSGLGFGTSTRIGGGLRTLPVGAVPLFYQTLLAGGLILPPRGHHPLAWMPTGGTGARDASHFDDSYYTREGSDPVPLSPPPLSPERQPNLFYLRRQQNGVDSTTTSPLV